MSTVLARDPATAEPTRAPSHAAHSPASLATEANTRLSVPAEVLERDTRFTNRILNVSEELFSLRRGTPGSIRTRITNEEVAKVLNDQLMHLDASDIAAIMQAFPERDRQNARIVLQQISQFASIEALQEIPNRLTTEGRTKIATSNDSSLGDLIEYLVSKKNVLSASSLDTVGAEFASAIILDERTIEAIRSNETLAKRIADGTVMVLIPEGFSTGINPFSDPLPSDIYRRVNDVLTQSHAIQEREPTRSLPEAIREVLTRPLIAALEEACKNHGPLSEYSPQIHTLTPPARADGETFEQTCLRQLNGTQRAPESKLQEVIEQLPEAYKPIARELITQTATVYSARSLAILARGVQNQILEYARERAVAPNEIGYYVAEAGRSYTAVSLIHRCATATPSHQIVSSTTPLEELKKFKILVMLDDLAGSGASLRDKGAWLHTALGESSSEQRIIIAPLVSTTYALARGSSLGSFIRAHDNVSAIPGAVIPRFVHTSLYRNIPRRAQEVLNRIIGNKGYNEDALCLSFPYMSPDNNHGLWTQHFAKCFTLRDAAVKKTSWDKPDQKKERTDAESLVENRAAKLRGLLESVGGSVDELVTIAQVAADYKEARAVASALGIARNSIEAGLMKHAREALRESALSVKTEFDRELGSASIIPSRLLWIGNSASQIARVLQEGGAGSSDLARGFNSIATASTTRMKAALHAELLEIRLDLEKGENVRQAVTAYEALLQRVNNDSSMASNATVRKQVFRFISDTAEIFRSAAHQIALESLQKADTASDTAGKTLEQLSQIQLAVKQFCKMVAGTANSSQTPEILSNLRGELIIFKDILGFLQNCRRNVTSSSSDLLQQVNVLGSARLLYEDAAALPPSARSMIRLAVEEQHQLITQRLDRTGYSDLDQYTARELLTLRTLALAQSELRTKFDGTNNSLTAQTANDKSSHAQWTMLASAADLKILEVGRSTLQRLEETKGALTYEVMQSLINDVRGFSDVSHQFNDNPQMRLLRNKNIIALNRVIFEGVSGFYQQKLRAAHSGDGTHRTASSDSEEFASLAQALQSLSCQLPKGSLRQQHSDNCDRLRFEVREVEDLIASARNLRSTIHSLRGGFGSFNSVRDAFESYRRCARHSTLFSSGLQVNTREASRALRTQMNDAFDVLAARLDSLANDPRPFRREQAPISNLNVDLRDRSHFLRNRSFISATLGDRLVRGAAALTEKAMSDLETLRQEISKPDHSGESCLELAKSLTISENALLSLGVRQTIHADLEKVAQTLIQRLDVLAESTPNEKQLKLGAFQELVQAELGGLYAVDQFRRLRRESETDTPLLESSFPKLALNEFLEEREWTNPFADEIKPNCAPSGKLLSSLSGPQISEYISPSIHDLQLNFTALKVPQKINSEPHTLSKSFMKSVMEKLQSTFKLK